MGGLGSLTEKLPHSGNSVFTIYMDQRDKVIAYG